MRKPKQPAPLPGPSGAVTVIVSRVVKRGREEEFEEWLTGVTHEAMQFEGHLGVEMIRPSDHQHPEYVVIFRFDSYSHLKAWETSAVRDQWLKRVEHLVAGEAHVEIVTGLEYWFTPPSLHSPPPRYKQAVVTWLAIFPLSTAIIFILQPFLQGFPIVVRGLAISSSLVLLMTYLVMPHMLRWFARWLFSSQS